MVVKLRDIADIQTGPFGSQLHEEDYVENGTPIVTVEHLGNRFFTEQNLPMVSDVDKKRLSKYTLKEGDIVFSRVGSVDRCSYVDKKHAGWLFSGRCLRVRPNPKKVNPLYLYYFFQLDSTKQQARNISVGATMPSLNTELMGSIDVLLPVYDEQTKIAAVLNSIDAKITINNEINDNLQQLITDIFVKWFYQFQYPNSEDKSKSGLPMRFILNKKLIDQLPSGWKVVSISNNPLCSFIDVGVPYFKTKNYLATANVINTSIEDGGNISYENRESRANMQPSINSVWIAKMKNSIKHIFIPPNGKWMIDKYVFSTGFTGLQCSNLTFAYIASVVMQPYFESTKDTLAHGATQESINNDDMDSLYIIVPAKDILEMYSKTVTPYFEKMNGNMLENQSLARARDELLPLLMNGQVTVR